MSLKLSIIIPVCNTAECLSQCLDSLLSQTYKNIEIIIVNDNPEKDYSKVVKNYMYYDDRVFLVENIERKGKLLSIVEGMKYATGDAFSFINPDGYLAKDVVRRYIKYISEGFDIVQCNFAVKKKNGIKYCFPNNMVRNGIWDNNSLRNHFFSQEGNRDCYFSIYNKAYSIDIWNRSIDLIEKFNKKISICEDLILSFIINLFAKEQINIEYYGVVHCDLDIINSYDEFEFEKIIFDLIDVFEFIDDYVIQYYQSKKFENNFHNWKALYSRIWYDKICNNFKSLDVKNKLILTLKSGFKGKNSCINTNKYDHYSYSVKNEYNEYYENLIKEICDKNTQFVVFDIFNGISSNETLEHKDIFLKVYMLAVEQNIISKSFNFVKHRINVEERLNILSFKKNRVCIDNIYLEMMNEHSYLSQDVFNRLKDIEISVEIESKSIGSDMIELVELCHRLNKNYFFMLHYQPYDIKLNMLIEKSFINIKSSFKLNLIKPGYNKFSINTFLDKLNATYESTVLYIGNGIDRYVYIDKETKIRTWKIQDPLDLMSGNTSYYNKDLYSCLFDDKYYYSQSSEEIKHVYLRVILSIIKNKLFSTENFSISNNSLVPYGVWGVGFACLGPYIHAIVNWLYKLIEKKQQRIIFLSRDGFLINEAFKLLYPELNVEYLRISRSSIISSLLAFENPEQELTNLIDYKKFSPRKLLKTMLPTINNSTLNKFDDFSFEKYFCSNHQMILFFRAIVSDDFCRKLLIEQSNSFINYIKSFKITDLDVLFDIGYKGTASYYINKVSKNNAIFSFLYIKSNRALIYNNKVKCFHSRVPHISGAMREFMLSETSNKTICYENNKPVLKGSSIKDSNLIAKDLQSGTLDFIFESKKYMAKLHCNIFSYEQGTIFIDHFLNHNFTDHRTEFSHVMFEDDVSSKNGLKCITEYWPIIFG
ncbi:TPA: glycosyltransferase [Photobacterium damselae]